MAEENRVILHGKWSSTYVKRVELALKIKGIPFEYVEEDLFNKSPSLIKYNPVHKKVPILVHDGKPIVESLVILEYIDETWKNEPRLLPEDPYQRATVRFWATYIQQFLDTSIKIYIAQDKEAQDKACQDTFEKLHVLEEGMNNFILENPRLINGEKMDILDIMIIATLGAFRAQEEVLGIKILDPKKHPLIFEWVTNLMKVDVVKEITASHEELVLALQTFRQNAAKFQTK
ncbi:Glutathione S-transferase [Handroanthus impetiginosus]|uniref:Glutathione S-transferase n=1 Tax=Handroanthus impetiginosus TaxID=429701 RepID=A0A2G9GNP6_9LAMI|nr:Glutathione S-transferase [Handroanthus impetiginosus]